MQTALNSAANKRKTSIRTRITSRMSLTVLVAVIAVALLCSFLSYFNTMDVLEATLAETSILAASRVEQEIITYKDIVLEAGLVPDLSDSAASAAEKQEIVDLRVELHGFERGFILDARGIDILSGENHSGSSYFAKAMSGEAYISEPMVNGSTLTTVVSAPIRANGVPDAAVVGVICFVPRNTYLNDVVSAIRVSENGGAYILDAQGTTIACEDLEVVLCQENVVRDYSDDPELAALAELEAKMALGQSGFGTYSYEGHTELMSYAPISGTNGWSLAVTSYLTDFTGTLVNCIVYSALLAIVSIFVSVFLAWRLANGIGNPLKACADRLDQLAEGDLSSPVPESKTNDEIGILLTASSKLQTDLQSIIHDFSYIMAELSQGNFMVESTDTGIYKNDYEEMLRSMQALCDRMGNTLRQIDATAGQVDTGAGQVSYGSQALSQGAVEQAASVEELAASLNQISEHIQSTSQYVIEADQKTKAAGQMAEQCNLQMHEMLKAMDDINQTSEEISKIIKTIEDIAFQTNILALNAAVEAARAGAAGKGFAVVADEVRNLASKSAEASQNTSVLIENSKAAVRRGTALAGDTAEQLQHVTDGNRVISELVSQIAVSSEEQAEAIKQVTIGIDQISTVIQSNSATAEESAAASAEMADQASVLKHLVDQFKLS